MEDESSPEVLIVFVNAMARALERIHPRLPVRTPSLRVYRRTSIKEPDNSELEDAEKLLDITSKAHDVLFSADTVFPFTLFPDTITLDREKLTIIQRSFFGVAKIVSSRIKDIQTIDLDVGPFFGSVKVSSRLFSGNPKRLTYLWRSDAARIARLVRGYVIAAQEEINCSNIPKEELILLLEDLGKSESE